MSKIRLAGRLILLLLSAFTLLATSSGVAWAKDYGLSSYYYHYERQDNPRATFTDDNDHVFVWSGQMSGLDQPPTSPRSLAIALKFQDPYANNIGGPVHCLSKATGTFTDGTSSWSDDSFWTPPALEHATIPKLRDFYSDYILTMTCDWYEKVTASDGSVSLEPASVQIRVEFRVGKNNH